MTTKISPEISLLSLAVLIEKRAEWEAYEPVSYTHLTLPTTPYV